MPEETVLIRPLPVERDVDGWWSHPDYLSEYDDEITEAQFMEWCLRNQVETKITYMESDVSIDVFDAYMDDRRCSGISESRRQPLYQGQGSAFHLPPTRMAARVFGSFSSGISGRKRPVKSTTWETPAGCLGIPTSASPRRCIAASARS